MMPWYEDNPETIMPGDICVVVSSRHSTAPEQLLFLITEVYGDSCRGVMVGVDVTLATEVDAILSAEEAGMACTIVVHSRYIGTISRKEVVSRVGAVTDGDLDDIELLTWTDHPNVSVRRGTPLQLPRGIDSRYPALKALSEKLFRFTYGL